MFNDNAQSINENTAAQTDNVSSSHESIVFDLTNSLSMQEKTILEKGFTFCPTNNQVNEFQLHCDLTDFARTLRLKEFFDSSDNDAPCNLSIRPESTFIPPSGRNHNLDLFIESVTHDVLYSAKNNHSQTLND